LWLTLEPMVMLYRGDVQAAWYQSLEKRERYLRSVQNRIMTPGVIELLMCGVATAACLRTTDPRERRQLERAAKRLARGARRIRMAAPGVPAACLACLGGDREGAIAALRRQLQKPLLPLYAHATRRRLGELLGDEEGKALIDEVDALLRAGGVIDPQRFTAVMMPGLELP
jgi:hypothetical protein